jgi:uncharacterized membrane protein
MSATSAPLATTAEQSGLQERISDVITGFCGDMRFVYIHTLVFAVWIATKGFGSDAFPFNFLTMAVSLEAIFLSTFILISQNRQQAIADANNKLVQARLLQMLDDVISDEKLDLKNEGLISVLLNRIDVEHIKPIADQVDAVAASVARIEQSIAARGGSQPPAPR